ncbi:retinoblastoma-like protein 1 isoform X2 [Anopheles darlingi]|uniref:retinoblastoma-like protein 1 isoform X2 n=1 Tax=Anopheles darlingi TaxID=43151 RepID=UPI0021004D32|nr:retinoblastoma-like protein 1 isoform X2 [Anopheles darlingi]
MTTTAEEGANSSIALRETHRKICRALNIDANTEDRSWESFEQTRAQYDLTGDPLHWMCCSLYVAGLQEIRPTVGNPDRYFQGNGVHITNLLKQCGINIQEFFIKINDWSSITSLPARLKSQIDNLQHEFTVAIGAYTAFNEDFPRIFNDTALTPEEPKRNKKAKPNPCSYNRLREFSWVLFLCVKEQHQEQRRDRTTVMNLAVCVMDLIYRNVVAEERLELLNPNMLIPVSGADAVAGGSTADGGTAALLEASRQNNIIAMLCSEYPTCSDSVAETNRTIFLPTLGSMFGTKDLRGTRKSSATGDGDEEEQFLNLLTVGNFDENLKSLNRRYERYILQRGMLDERIALNTRMTNSNLRQRWCVTNHPRTPLSVKSLAGRTMPMPAGINEYPASGSNALVLRGTLNQLMKKIQGHKPGQPRDSFLNLLKSCAPNPLAMVLERVVRMRARFVGRLTQEGWNARNAEARFDNIEALYYQLVENIIPWERRKRTNLTPSKVIYEMCANDLFNETAIVCAAEIIIRLRQEQNSFPWILGVFEMQPLDFYRIIEVTVVANSEILTTDIVNHLRRVEEQVIDSLCWTRSSVLWEKMEKENYQIPQNKDVEQSAQIAGVTPLKGDWIPNTPNSAIRGNCANGGSDSTAPGQSMECSPVRGPNGAAGSHSSRLLNFFFRKVYVVAYARLKDLCQSLGLDSTIIQTLIWTIFEYAITHNAKELMRDRHLDQLLMCSIFVTIRIKKLQNTFKDIMSCYQKQPQSSSSIYRSVFIRDKPASPESAQPAASGDASNGAQGDGNGSEEQQQQQQQQQERVPISAMAGTSVEYNRQEFGDIIKFYNDIYVKIVHPFAIKYYNADMQSLFLSPTPRAQPRNIHKSPRQIRANINLYVSTTDKTNTLLDSPNAHTYTFHQSPAKDLELLNQRVRGSADTCVRRLTEPSAFSDHPVPKVRRLSKIHQDRQQHDKD